MYRECISNSTTYEDGAWQFALPDGTVSMKLDDVDSLRSWGVYVPDNPSFTGYRYEPERACLAACVAQMGDDCREFTYDGISQDRHAILCKFACSALCARQSLRGG